MPVIFNDNPLIALALWDRNDIWSGDPSGSLVFCPYWYPDVSSVTRWYTQWQATHRHLRAVLLSNGTDSYQKLLGKIPLIQATTNFIVDETIFKPLFTPKKYSAIYVSNILPFKRHELARDIPCWSWVTYCAGPATPDRLEWFQRVLQVNGVVLQNEIRDGKPVFLQRYQVNRCINEAKVGLALSAEEGAMFALTEYLLAGLPVVTTPARGGREEWFDSEFVTIVEPDAGAVARAVWGWERRLPDPRVVRRWAMQRLVRQRRQVVGGLQAECERWGIGIDLTRQVWPRLYRYYEYADLCMVSN